ncbi:MAG TPA: DUF2442 domain-containing protein [Nitrospiraceae bacterium]|nr:DUF2442 domain-containing protein [Nitrospiraceae bacterium]
MQISEDKLIVDIMDGRTISVPLAWYPRLFNATPAQRTNWNISAAVSPMHTSAAVADSHVSMVTPFSRSATMGRERQQHHRIIMDD